MNPTPSNYIPLESIQIATPCRADWDKMTGDEQARFCGSCAKNVYNFAAMTRAEAEALIKEKEGHLCVRLYRREDGTVITSDCAVGISPVKRAPGIVRALMATVMTAILAVFGVRSVQAKDTVKSKPAVTLGEPVMGAVPAPQPTMGRPAPMHTMGIIAPPQVKPTAKPVKNSAKPKNPKKSATHQKSHR